MVNKRLQQLKQIKSELPDLFEQMRENPSDLNNAFHMIAALASAVSVMIDDIIEYEELE